MSARRYLAPWRRAAAATRGVAPGQEGQDVLAALEGKPALYHCISRAVWQEMAFGESDKERFAALLRKWEAFSQVRVLTFCVMTNHFHLLVEVPERPEQDPGDGELLEHLALIYGGGKLAEIRWELEHYRSQGNHAAAEALRQRFLRRMWDLSVFMKALKQEFTVWWNKRHGKKGNLWEDKFKSVLVEDGRAARMVAAYIDLNPVRAGMAGKAEDYRWSGWGEAVAGRRKAREGIRQVMLERELARSGPRRALRDVADWKEVLAGYAGLLDEDQAAGTKEAPVPGDRQASPGKPAKPRLSEAAMLRRRVRYFVDGMVIGSQGFVDGVFNLSRGWFGAKRRSGARRLALAATPLRSMRALKVTPYGHGEA